MKITSGRAARVAVVVPTLRQGGAERVAVTLAAEFSEVARVTLVTFDPRVSRRTLAQATHVPWADLAPVTCDHVHLPAASSGASRLVVLATRFASLARRRRFDVVYSFLTYTNVLVALSRTVAGGRYVHIASEHAMADSLYSDGPRMAMLARLLPIVYRAPDRIVVVSDAARRSLVIAGAVRRPDRAVTIYNPIDVAAVRTLSTRPVSSALLDRLEPQRIVVACVARLHKQKDHNTLLRAMSRLPAWYLLLLVGDGPLRMELERLATELGVGDRTVFVGAVDNPYPIMRRADVVALASVEEGFGLVAVEAAALGVPFVGSNVGGLGEVCEMLGYPRRWRTRYRGLPCTVVSMSPRTESSGLTWPMSHAPTLLLPPPYWRRWARERM
jgi:glycosyltransferase involved in cell wall biosynthesis